jgi:hypothetical protein
MALRVIFPAQKNRIAGGKGATRGFGAARFGAAGTRARS